MRRSLSTERRIGGRGVKSQCVRLIWAALFLSLTASATRGQSPTGRPGVHEEAPCPASSKAGGQPVEPPCASSSPPKSAAEQFPFPGEAASKTAKPPSSSTQSGDPAKKFPYPGDPSADDSSSSSSSRNSSSSSSRSGIDDSSPEDAPKPPGGRRKLAKVKQLQSDEDRESEDLDVAKYYLQAGNHQAAYLRASDAVHLQPSDSDAHYLLGAAAEHLGKKDEAVKEYSAYLKLDPDGDKAKAVEKALATLK